MVLVDTCGWIEWLTDGALSKSFGTYLKTPSKLLVPSIIQFELYKWICRERDQTMALNIIAVTEESNVVSIDTHVALTAADVARKHKLAMADALIYACCEIHNVELITCDSHFKQLPGVKYFPKK